MTEAVLIEKIAEKDFNVDEFVQLAISDENVRDEIVNQMLTNSAIQLAVESQLRSYKTSPRSIIS